MFWGVSLVGQFKCTRVFYLRGRGLNVLGCVAS